jgi:hypothetical protein
MTADGLPFGGIGPSGSEFSVFGHSYPPTFYLLNSGVLNREVWV